MSKLCPFKQPPHAACVEESCPLWDATPQRCAFLTIALYMKDVGTVAWDWRHRRFDDGRAALEAEIARVCAP